MCTVHYLLSNLCFFNVEHVFQYCILNQMSFLLIEIVIFVCYICSLSLAFSVVINRFIHYFTCILRFSVCFSVYIDQSILKTLLDHILIHEYKYIYIQKKRFNYFFDFFEDNSFFNLLYCIVRKVIFYSAQAYLQICFISKLHSFG